jgi:hypothetical protein
MFPVKNGLKQGDALSLLLFNLTFRINKSGMCDRWQSILLFTVVPHNSGCSPDRTGIYVSSFPAACFRPSKDHHLPVE